MKLYFERLFFYLKFYGQKTVLPSAEGPFPAIGWIAFSHLHPYPFMAIMQNYRTDSGIKRHLAVDSRGLPHLLPVTTANVSDKAGACPDALRVHLLSTICIVWRSLTIRRGSSTPRQCVFG